MGSVIGSNIVTAAREVQEGVRIIPAISPHDILPNDNDTRRRALSAAFETVRNHAAAWFTTESGGYNWARIALAGAVSALGISLVGYAALNNHRKNQLIVEQQQSVQRLERLVNQQQEALKAYDELSVRIRSLMEQRAQQGQVQDSPDVIEPQIQKLLELQSKEREYNKDLHAQITNTLEEIERAADDIRQEEESMENTGPDSTSQPELVLVLDPKSDDDEIYTENSRPISGIDPNNEKDLDLWPVPIVNSDDESDSDDEDYDNDEISTDNSRPVSDIGPEAYKLSTNNSKPVSDIGLNDEEDDGLGVESDDDDSPWSVWDLDSGDNDNGKTSVNNQSPMILTESGYSDSDSEIDE